MSSFLLRWRVATHLFSTRWRGPSGMLDAIAHNPNAPLAGFVVPAATSVTPAPTSWGDIEGLIDDQVDLKAALDGKQPISATLSATTAAFTSEYEATINNLAPVASSGSYEDLVQTPTHIDGGNF